MGSSTLPQDATSLTMSWSCGWDTRETSDCNVRTKRVDEKPDTAPSSQNKGGLSSSMFKMFDVGQVRPSSQQNHRTQCEVAIVRFGVVALPHVVKFPHALPTSTEEHTLRLSRGVHHALGVRFDALLRLTSAGERSPRGTHARPLLVFFTGGGARCEPTTSCVVVRVGEIFAAPAVAFVGAGYTVLRVIFSIRAVE